MNELPQMIPFSMREKVTKDLHKTKVSKRCKKKRSGSVQHYFILSNSSICWSLIRKCILVILCFWKGVWKSRKIIIKCNAYTAFASETILYVLQLFVIYLHWYSTYQSYLKLNHNSIHIFYQVLSLLIQPIIM